jgi:[acyl-carrier-protein] S-malonyltransferase
MLPAHERLADDLNALSYDAFGSPIVHNVDAAVNSDPDKVCDALTRQVSSPVRWLQSVETLVKEGVDTVIEIGAGKVLSGLVRQIDRDVRCLNVENLESLRNTLDTV